MKNVSGGRMHAQPFLSVAERLPVVKLRPATPPDAAPIFDLATDVFGSSQLLYSIYQAPNSVRYLQRLIASASPTHWITVATAGELLVGYYEARIGEGEAFLNYIATRPDCAGKGIGRQLLADVKRVAVAADCTRLALDVFLNNRRALQWYRELGFQQDRAFQLMRVALDDIPLETSSELLFQPQDYASATKDEEQWGAGRFNARCRGGSLSIGVIGGHTCKLIAWDGVGFGEAVSCIATFFRPSRKFIILSPGDTDNVIWPSASRETVLRWHLPINQCR